MACINGGIGMSGQNDSSNGANGSENRGHFLVDINTVFPFLGKRYFLIFYFGRHLHPRQKDQLVNQRTLGNWAVIVLLGALLFGFVYATSQIIGWRLDQGSSTPSGASTQLFPGATNLGKG